MSTGTFIDDFVSNAIDIAIAAIGSEGEGQGAAAPQHETQIMVNATRSTYNISMSTRILHPHVLCPHICGDFCG